MLSHWPTGLQVQLQHDRRTNISPVWSHKNVYTPKVPRCTVAAKPNLAAMTFHADEARGRLRTSSKGPLQNARQLQSLGATDECRQPRNVKPVRAFSISTYIDSP